VRLGAWLPRWGGALVIALFGFACAPAAVSQAATQTRSDPSDVPDGPSGRADLREVVWDVGAASATVTVRLDASTFGVASERALIGVHVLIDANGDGIADHEVAAARNVDGLRVDVTLRELDGTLSTADCQDLDGKSAGASATVSPTIAAGIESFAFSFDPALVAGALGTFRWAGFSQAPPDGVAAGPWDVMPDAANPEPAAVNPGDRRCDSAKSGRSVRMSAGVAFPDPISQPPPAGPPAPVPPPPAPEPLPAPQFSVSTQTPRVGQRVVFDASALDRVHGGARRYLWDLDGDGTFERNTHLAPAVSLAFGKVGRIRAAVAISYADGASALLFDALDVGAGKPPAACAVYCRVGFPFTPAGGAGCRTAVEVGLVRVEADCLRARGRALVATHRVRLNGLDLYVAGAGEIVVDPAAMTIDAPGLATLQYAEFTLALLRDVHWSGLDGESGSAEMPNIIPGPTASVEGFGITGRLGVSFRRHVATFDAHVAMPEDMGDFDAQLRLSVTAENPATLDELHVSLPVGKLQDTLPIDHLELDYQAAANAWSGAVGVNIGDYSVTAAVAFHLNPSLGLDGLGASIGGLNVSIYAGVFLDEIRFAYATSPAPSFSGGITLTYGPTVREISLISAEGNFTLTFSDPAVIHIDGEGKVLGLKVAAVDARYSLDGNLTLDASLRLGIDVRDPHHVPYWEDGTTPPLARISGELHGWADGPSRTFSSAGAGEACLGLCIAGRVVMSSTGVAGCGAFGPAVVGAGYTWSSGRFEWFGGACDLGRWTPSPPAGARAAAVLSAIELPAGLPVAAVKIVGLGAAPRVTLLGPRGERVVTPAGSGGARAATSLVAVDESTATTYVALARPSGGTWRIMVDPASVPVVSVEAAQALPAVSVRARVGRGGGARRMLSYRVKPIAGQKVSFAEQRAGRVGHLIGVARGAAGRLRFTPGAGPAGIRSIVAQVSQGGLPRRSLVVAHYRAPAPLRPGRPRSLRLRRTARTLRVTWRPSSGRPRSYEVLVTTINHRRELFRVPAGRRHVSVRDVRFADRAVVTVTPLDATGQPGRSARMVARARRP
jgi:hypothetical protein